MTTLPTTLLYSQDEALTCKVEGYLGFITTVRHCRSPRALDALIVETGPTVLLLDIRGENYREIIANVHEAAPDMLVVALAVPRSEPALDAMSLDVYAVEDVELERQPFQSLVNRALAYAVLHRENQALREETARRNAYDKEVPATPVQQAIPESMKHFSRAYRQFQNIDVFFDRIVEGVASVARVSRVGLFSWDRDTQMFRLRAGLHCLDETRGVEMGPASPLVRWLTKHTHLVSRATLVHIHDPAERAILTRHLNATGAEVIVPLLGRGRLLGWLDIGRRVTGLPFEYPDLEGLSILAEHVSTTMENALLYEDSAVQRTLTDTLLRTIPLGIVALDEEGTIRCVNDAAEQSLGGSADQLLDQPARILGSQMADLLNRTLEGEATPGPVELVDRATGRTAAVRAHRLMDNDRCLGAMALLKDLTADQLHEHEREHNERATFWSEMAPSISHELRSPLVAIKTFAQLLPERYKDADFRRDFTELVVGEVDRMLGTIEQIAKFAHPKELILRSLDVRQPVREGIELALPRAPDRRVTIDTKIGVDLAAIQGDHEALAECFAQVIVNAIEATMDEIDPRIELTAEAVTEGDESRILVVVRDNGCGIPENIRDDVFSPLCTTKERGMGLGLPIAQQTLARHNGSVKISPEDKGTRVSLSLPCEKAAG